MISPISPISPIVLISFFSHSIVSSGLVHLLSHAAFLHKVGLQATDEFPQHHIFLVDEGDGDVGYSSCRAALYLLAIVGGVVVEGAQAPSDFLYSQSCFMLLFLSL